MRVGDVDGRVGVFRRRAGGRAGGAGRQAGITNFKRVPALNSDPLFISTLADLTLEALDKPVRTGASFRSLWQGASALRTVLREMVRFESARGPGSAPLRGTYLKEKL
jgi:hypothetical protein